MRTSLLLPAILLTVLLWVTGTTYAVSAVGAPSENVTTPDPPLSDNNTPEIKPANYILKDPTAQTQSLRPLMNFDFAAQLSRDQYTVTGNETWELYIDINMPGWIYIYEYLPTGSNPDGRWIAYKWQVPQSGIWKLGPFTPAQTEPEGKHIYQAWYFADGKWAADDPQAPYKMVTWTYVKGAPVQTVTVPTIPLITTPREQPTDPFMKFITNPIVLLAGPSLIVIIIIFIRYFLQKARDRKSVAELIPPAPKVQRGKAIPETKEEKAPIAAAAVPEIEVINVRAILVLPNGLEIPLNKNNRVIGRMDLARALELDNAGLISRKHFEITRKDADFFIEDCGSANGTSLNGNSIKDKGPLKLNDDDLIEPGNAVKLRFQIL